MKKFLKLIIIMSLAATVVISTCGCGVAKYDDIDEDKLLIVTTLFPQYDFAKQVAGDKAEVILLLSPGIEAHDFEPTPSDIILINKADLFIYTGDEMEPWVSTILESVDNKNLTILDVSEGIEVICEEENHSHNHVHEEEEHDENSYEDNDHNEDNHNEDNHNDSNIIFDDNSHESHDHSHSFDPHIWTSPVNAIKMIEAIEEAIVGIDSSNGQLYKDNAHNYIGQLEEVDGKIREVVSNANDKTIYFGGRFAMSYFANEYGLSYAAAFDSCQAESEPSARLIVKIIEKMRENGAKYIFYEEMTEPKASRIIAEEIGGEILLLHSCHNVSKTEMEEGATYLSLMNQNLLNLQKALR